MGHKLNRKDSQRRQFVLEGNMWQVVLSISLPLAMYNCFNGIFVFLDTLMASHISSDVVSAIAYLSQIKSTISAIGIGLSVAGGIIIARYYGAGDLKTAKKYVNTLLFLSLIIGIGLLVIVVPSTKPILRFINTPEELINVGSTYFAIEIVTIVSIFINNVYIAVEKAKGNTKKILFLNLMVLAIKLPLTALFIYVFNFGITMIAIASLIAHMSLTLVGIFDMINPQNVFKISSKDIDLSWKVVKPILILGLPIFFERFTFSFGKVIVNSMSTFYGSIVVGALGISNNIGGIITGTSGGFQEGEVSIIGQNLGNKNLDRALDAFKKTLIITAILGTIGFIFTGIYMDQIIALFAKGDMVFAREIKNIFKYERYALITLTISSAIMGLLYGFGYTKISLALNFARLFIFRIPVLYLLQNYTSLGSESVGVTMVVSNVFIGVTSAIVCWFVVKKIRKENNGALTLQ